MLGILFISNRFNYRFSSQRITKNIQIENIDETFVETTKNLEQNDRSADGFIIYSVSFRVSWSINNGWSNGDKSICGV